ncbi:D-glycerate dehydrogenase [Sphingomonas sp. H39-1-10]|uniref:2-hydroxyacid dehydrogenase n=1 Tax=Sphingomonas pollutisoli TaxID=3030829 RepID=UPI0023B8F93A|nr:D-glycerate dehydrogenase [Sphingomonas pollutisoli]MDF0487153.1 D-glycerate dehydrogenase [Sphingomonas pollutisoli]
MTGAPARPRVRVTRRLPEAVEARLAATYDVVFNVEDRALDADELRAALTDFDAVVPTITDRLDAAVIATEGRRARMLANYGAGVDHIDLAAARAAGIAVSNTPGALTEATAELAILLMLMAARRAGEGEREVRAGTWTGWRPTHLVGQSLAGRTLGLIGFGRIAQRTAARARGLGMEIRYFSRSAAAPEIEASLAATRVASAEALFETADVISLHIPGGADTHHFVGAALLARAKPTAILVNTARGSVIDEAALVAALADGRIAAVGLDVYEREPAISPGLIDSPRAVLLPHLGSATLEARTAMGMQVIDNLDAFFGGGQMPDRVA